MLELKMCHMPCLRSNVRENQGFVVAGDPQGQDRQASCLNSLGTMFTLYQVGIVITLFSEVIMHIVS